MPVRKSGKAQAPKGKISAGLFERVILPQLGRRRKEVQFGPQIGLDNGIIALNRSQVLAVTTDPFFIMPELGWERAAWFAVHIIASDAATSGLPPAYMSIDLNLPPEMSEREFKRLWDATHSVCDELGIAIVTGHTGWYENCSYPMLGAATIFSVGSANAYVTPSMARAGDAILMTKGAAIETTGIFGVMFKAKIEAALGKKIAREAEAMFRQMSVVKDALTAVKGGVRSKGVTGMHDATERGVLGALCEIAETSGLGMLIDKNAIPVTETTRRVCELFDVDPYSTSSEGTLIITCRSGKRAEIMKRLADARIPAAHIGEMSPHGRGVKIVRDGIERRLTAPKDDPFWPAYVRARKEAGKG